jgi:hypothetical protein
MWKSVRVLACLLLAAHPIAAFSSDACSTRGIAAAADVSVSDGSGFRIESYYQSKVAAAIRHIDESDRIIAVEGPLGWIRHNDESEVGSDFLKLFALGHQFHAFLFDFDDIASNLRQRDNLAFRGEQHRATSGDYPYGGIVHLVHSDDDMRPAGLLFEFPEDTVVSVGFDDWRDVGGAFLPFHMQIDDGERIFDYYYSEIDVSPKSPLWFFEVVTAPAIDTVQVYRLHRKLLAAHCLGDADLMAKLSAPQLLVAGGGELREVSNEAMRERFAGLFEAVNYTEYVDIAMPVIELANSADLGWIAVSVRAGGSANETGAAFSDQWAWVMMVRKIDNEWVHAGNASNLAE